MVERKPLGATWHPGDVAWELRGAYGEGQPIRFWKREDQVLAVAWFVGPGQLWLEAAPSTEHLVTEIIDWGEDFVRRVSSADGPTLSVRANHADVRRIECLTRLGYRQAGPEAVQFERDLAGELPQADLPAGYSIRDGEGIDGERRAASHRTAWNDLRSIGIENASSGLSAEIYESVRRSAVYRPELDLVVEDPEGRYVANCIRWADIRSGVGVFEPMGTDPEYRGRCLARVLIAEGMRRLRRLGHTQARIGTAHFNKPAIVAYSALFRPFDRTSWSKAL